MRDHGSIGPFLGIVFLVGNLALSVFFLFCFCLVRGEKVTSAQDFGWQSQGEDRFKLWFPFFSYLLVTILYCSNCLVWRPFYTFPFCFLPILIGNLFFPFVFFQRLIGNPFFFSLLFSSNVCSGTFFLFLTHIGSLSVSDSSSLGDPTIPYSEDRDENSHSGSRFMVVWGLGSKGLQNGRMWRMSGCWFGQQLRDKGNVPHY